MSPGVIDLEWLDKKISQAEHMNSATLDGLLYIRTRIQPIEPIINETWYAAQRATGDREGWINVSPDKDIPQLSEFKKSKGWQDTK